jgi:hypothetical protein
LSLQALNIINLQRNYKLQPKLSKKYKHQTTNHSAGQYVNGLCHTNGMENFWSLLKRGIVGQYHYVTPRYLDKYITEFSFRQNNRKNDNVFELVLQKALI